VTKSPQGQPRDVRLMEFVRDKVVPIYRKRRRVLEKNPEYLKAIVDGGKAVGLSLTGPVGAFIQALQGSLQNQQRDKKIALVGQLAALSYEEIRVLAGILEIHSDEVQHIKRFYTSTQEYQNRILNTMEKLQAGLGAVLQKIEELPEKLGGTAVGRARKDDQSITITLPPDWRGTIDVKPGQYRDGMAGEVLEEDVRMRNEECRTQVHNLSKEIQEKTVPEEVSKIDLRNQSSRTAFHALLQAGDVAFESGDLKLAEQNFKAAVTHASKMSDTHLLAVGLTEVGVALGKQGSHREALKYLDQAIGLDQSLLLGHWNRGIAYFELGEYEKAIDDYSKALEIDPKDARVQGNRGNAYFELGEYEKAIDDYSKALEIDPKDPGFYSNRGTTYTALGEYEKAIDDFNKALEINPEYAKAYCNRGSAYFELGEYERTMDDYSKALEIDPKDPRAYFNRGTIYATLGEYERTIDDYSKALEIDPEYAKAYCNRGNAYFKLEEYEKAIDDYNKALEIDPEYAKAYCNRGSAYFKLEEYEKAIDDYNKALEIGPKDAIAMVNLGFLYIRAGNKQQGLQFLSRADKMRKEAGRQRKERC